MSQKQAQNQYQEQPQQQIVAAMQQLVAEGKAITTAAVRARLTSPVPLSELLALVSRYKQAPDSLPPAAPATKAPNMTNQTEPQAELNTRLQALEQLIAEQARRLTHLENLLLTNAAKD